MTVAKNLPGWRKECLLIANQQLESAYRKEPTACLALQISRNYRLLLTQLEQPDIKQHWQSHASHWWQIYCELRQISAQPLFFSN